MRKYEIAVNSPYIDSSTCLLYLQNTIPKENASQIYPIFDLNEFHQLISNKSQSIAMKIAAYIRNRCFQYQSSMSNVKTLRTEGKQTTITK